MTSPHTRTSTSRLPWLPLALTSLSRNEGLHGIRIRPDNINLPLAKPQPRTDCTGNRCRPLPITYTTRRGELFLYPSTMEADPSDMKVTPTQLKILADVSYKRSAIKEAQNYRKNRMGDRCILTGNLKRNLEFPENWVSPGRETVPQYAIEWGLSIGEFLREYRRGDAHNNASKPLANGENSFQSLNCIDKYNRFDRTTKSQRNIVKAQGGFHNQRRIIELPPLEINSSHSSNLEDSSRLMSRSSLISDQISFMDGRWGSTTSENEDFALKSIKSDEESDWTDNSTPMSQADVLFHPQSTCQKNSSGVIPKRNKAVAFHRAQINVNALYPESVVNVSDEPSGTTQHQQRQQPVSPSMGTVNTITVTTCPSSRWSRATPNQTQTHPLSPNRTTPISEPSRKAMQTSLLETAKLLLSESSKLEPVPLVRDPNLKHYVAEQMVGGGDAGLTGADHEETGRVRNNRERRRQHEANELHKQIEALNSTIERLIERTKEKADLLNNVIQDTMKQIKMICVQREINRRHKMKEKRQITRALFLRHFRDRQTRKRRLRLKLGLNNIRTQRTHLGPIPASLASKEQDESDALRKWEANEDKRDEAENALAVKQEEEAAVKATSKLKWLKEVTNAHLKHLEEFLKVTNPQESDDATSNINDSSLEFQLPVLRSRHYRLVTLLHKYGITAEDEEKISSNTCQSLLDSKSVSATIALRNLWADLAGDKLCRMQRAALGQFERLIQQGCRSALARSILSPNSKQHRQWRREAAILQHFGKVISGKHFSYFDFWPAPVVESSDEGESDASDNSSDGQRKLKKLPTVSAGPNKGEAHRPQDPRKQNNEPVKKPNNGRQYIRAF
ncbi:hypothetical protein CSKR_106436 [Clonorchis sinensis]|uniref:Uncharacterized protein n=1 Tax=Clonorchis sinensis TaxID=79923 RepID=A0A8T1N334_CLOSI|nr:hypothetical protein CSKR_106436 [Clonorchis sinensis]